MKKAFTLAEVLITLAIIGVVAALTIPSVVTNTQQSEFKTGLRKAVSVLNSAITTTSAIEGITPYDINYDINTVTALQRFAVGLIDTPGDDITLYSILSPHMSIMKKTSFKDATSQNFAFYTTDGMRFEIPINVSEDGKLKLHETGASIGLGMQGRMAGEGGGPACGSFGLADNPFETQSGPCMIVVDVNGDRKPNPTRTVVAQNGETTHDAYKVPAPSEKLFKDVFTIMITDRAAIPFGVIAQRAMYNAK